MKVVWSPLALQKLGDAAEFIALDNPSAAEKWVNEVFDKTELLGSSEIIFGHYRIIYSLSHEIRVLTVRNCRQLLTEHDV
ncbi:type II toxin-antitoxin system RelE/ParE family toxin [Vibrio cholerae]|uniref:type II toxin-antitoxin system RelE/ParE family toxin n=1 Tax=Vibrio cholerae TaxID=666 RepID=UPI001E611B34|nr:type II toxin-antitoxin system RelE/ParE family toxin [Vibrio cholerae]